MLLVRFVFVFDDLVDTLDDPLTYSTILTLLSVAKSAAVNS